MGGHEKGEVASNLAVTSLRVWLSAIQPDSFSSDQFIEIFHEINSTVRKQASEAQELTKIGTTLTALLITTDTAFVAHVGDSRAYLFRNRELQQLTKDHSLIGEQIRTGKLSWEAAKNHPSRHILTRAVGVREFMEVDLIQTEIKKDDILLLCSDGIHGMISDEKIKGILLSAPFSKVAETLVSAANEAGGLDNSTAVAVQISSFPVFYPSHFSWYRFKKLMLSRWFDAT